MDTFHYLQTHALLLLTITVILGLVIGSFLNVVIYRFPIMMQHAWQQECRALLGQPQKPQESIFNLFVPRSHCPACKQIIPAAYNIPIFSYLYLRGKCQACKKRISPRYLLIEILCAVVSTFVVYKLGLSWQTFPILLLTWSLIALTFIDFDHQFLYDEITLPLLWLGLLLNLNTMFVTPKTAIIGAIAGYMSLWIIAQLFKLIRGIEGMGYGDFKLLAVFGAWLGWQILPFIILLSSLIGASIGITLMLLKGYKRYHAIPFGPYIAVAGWAAIFWGKDLINWYLRFSGLS